MSKPTSSQADDITMSGGGSYSAATIGAKDVIDRATPLALDALAHMESDTTTPFVFADMGCADGGTSLELVRRVVGAVRERSPRREIQINYLDQPRNDYNALIGIVHGLSEFKSYLNDYDRLYVSASGTSFYLQGLLSDSLDLGFSATAMHWLSRKPCDIQDHVQAVGAKGSEDTAFREQAERDWELILSCRARELRKGGRFVFANFCVDEQGRYLGNTDGISMFDTFRDIWREFVERKIISQREYVGMTLPQYYRNLEQFCAPLLNPDSDAYKAGLRLEQAETGIVRCPFAAAHEQHNDAKRFAAEYIPTLRSWTESTFLGALSPERSLKERNEIIDKYYATYESRVAQSPAGHAMDYVHAYMVMRKT